MNNTNNITGTGNQTFCGECWRSMAQNNFCFTMFFIYVTILVFVTGAITVYHFRRKKVTSDGSNAFYWMFLFVALWIMSRTVYFLDTWINFNWIALGFLGSIPIFFTFMCFSVAIDSM